MPRRSEERGGLGAARRYRPRGATVREADPLRQALRLVDSGGGRSDRTSPADRAQRAERPALRVLAGGAGSQAGTGKTRQAGRPTRRGRGQPDRDTGRPKGSRPARTRRRKRAPRAGDPRRRLRLGSVLLLVLLVVLAGRLVQLQLTDARAYADEGLSQRLSQLVLHAPRGAIVDRSGKVFAQSVEARYVAADPVMIEDAKLAADQLSPVLGIPRSELLDKMQRRNRANGKPLRFEYLVRGAEIELGEAVRALNIKGIRVDYDEKRILPGHDLAANVVGFTGRDGTGLHGMEARFQEVLRGADGERVVEVGRNGRDIPNGYQRQRDPRPGEAVQLTLDRDLQYEVQRLLTGPVQQLGATFGTAVVLDVQTGEVLALASLPTYDAATPLAAHASAWVDYNTGAVVEPGSIHKAIVVGAALQEGVIRADSTLVVPPTITKGGQVFEDTHEHGTVRMTIPGILAHSSNVGTITIAEQLGAQRLYEYQRRFGLGAVTAAGLDGEAEGFVHPPSRWSGPSYGSIPIGLGVATTPMQMAAVYATIANDGVWVQPQLVRGTIGADQTLARAAEPARRTVLEPRYAADLRQMLEAVVVAPDATGRRAAIPQYRVAGKTGTGLKAENNRYAPGYVSSFVGMAPADAPRYVVGVFAHVPGGGGGAVINTVFRDVMSFTLQHFRIPPTGTKPPSFQIYA